MSTDVFRTKNLSDEWKKRTSDHSTMAPDWRFAALELCPLDFGPESGRPHINANDQIFTAAERISAGKTATAFRELFKLVDQLAAARYFDDVSSLLIAARVQAGIQLKLLVGLLTITLPFRHEVSKARAALVDEVRQRAMRIGGEQKVRAVLHGLE